MIKKHEYTNRFLYERLPITMAEATANCLMFSPAEVGEAWDCTPISNIRIWLNTNLEQLIKEGLISLDHASWRIQLSRDSRISEMLSDNKEPGLYYTFHVQVRISNVITGGQSRSIILYVSSKNASNNYIIPFERFRSSFGL